MGRYIKLYKIQLENSPILSLSIGLKPIYFLNGLKAKQKLVFKKPFHDIAMKKSRKVHIRLYAKIEHYLMGQAV